MLLGDIFSSSFNDFNNKKNNVRGLISFMRIFYLKEKIYWLKLLIDYVKYKIKSVKKYERMISHPCFYKDLNIW